jgi:hypothetical protein
MDDTEALNEDKLFSVYIKYLFVNMKHVFRFLARLMNSISTAADFAATQKRNSFLSGWSVSDLRSRVSLLTHS